LLLVDPNTVRSRFRRYQQGGLPGLLATGYTAHPQHNPVLGHGWTKRGKDH
jgi:hypothetical protein